MYLLNSEGTMAEVMRLDLVELGLVPQDVIEEVEEREVWKRLREDRPIERVEIMKRGKILVNGAIVQTQYTDYTLNWIVCWKSVIDKQEKSHQQSQLGYEKTKRSLL